MSYIGFSTNSKVMYEIRLKRRLTVIQGDSGVGKTNLVKTLNDAKAVKGLISYKSHNLVACSTDAELDKAHEVHDSIIVIDCDEFRHSQQFIKIIRQAVSLNNYVVLYTREIIDLVDKDDSAKLFQDDHKKLDYDFAVECLQTIVYVNGINRNVPAYRLDLPTVEYDYIFTEDSGGGLKFYQAINNKVKTTNGNGDVKSYIEGLSGNILLLVDLANYGRHVKEIIEFNEDAKNTKAYLLPDYECIEELLIRTNRLNNIQSVREHFRNPEVLANNFLTWEKFYEFFIHELTKGTKYLVTHSSHPKLKECWYVNCGESPEVCNEYRCKSCSSAISGDKMYELFKGTKYEYLYHILKEKVK